MDAQRAWDSILLHVKSSNRTSLLLGPIAFVFFLSFFCTLRRMVYSFGHILPLLVSAMTMLCDNLVNRIVCHMQNLFKYLHNKSESNSLKVSM